MSATVVIKLPKLVSGRLGAKELVESAHLEEGVTFVLDGAETRSMTPSAVDELIRALLVERGLRGQVVNVNPRMADLFSRLAANHPGAATRLSVEPARAPA